MKTKRLLLLPVISLLVFILGACGGQPMNSAEKDYPVKLYYASSLYVETGQDQQNGDIMPPMETTVTGNPETIYKNVLTALRTEPDDKTYTTLLADNIVINSVTLKNDTAYVDFSSEGLNGGSLEELLLIEQIVRTLTRSFPEIAQVQFTVDGEIVESLMGHMDISQPIQ